MFPEESATNYSGVLQVLSETISKDKLQAAKKDFTNYFNISLKSANESKLWFSILKDSGRATAEEVEKYLKELDEISKISGSSILTLKNKR